MVRVRAVGRRLLVVAGVAAAVTAVPVVARAALLPPLPLPFPTTTTTQPPTTTTTAPPTTTTQPPTTTTTRPPTTTTTRPATTTTTRPRRTTTTTAANGSGGASGPAATDGSSTPSPTSRTVARNARRRVPVAAAGPIDGSRPSGSSPPPGGSSGPAPTDRALPNTGGDRTVALGRTTTSSSGVSDVVDAMPWPLALAGLIGALVLAAAMLARIRSRDPYLRAAHLGAGTLVVERDDEETDVADRLAIAVRSGAVLVVGRDCRGLQQLVKVAAQEGLEIVDPDGYLVLASRRLVEAKGLVPDRRRLPLSWSVTVERPTVAVTEGWNLRSTDAADGRVLSFAPGSSLLLWDGDCLR